VAAHVTLSLGVDTTLAGKDNQALKFVEQVNKWLDQAKPNGADARRVRRSEPLKGADRKLRHAGLPCKWT